MDKTNSLNREMLRLMSEVFNGVEPSVEEFEMLESQRTVCKARALLRQLRRDGWTICPPLPALTTPSAEGDTSHVVSLDGRTNPNHCGCCFAPESAFRLWHCPECSQDLCVGCLRRSQCTRCIKDRPGWDKALATEEHEEVKVGGTSVE